MSLALSSETDIEAAPGLSLIEEEEPNTDRGGGSYIELETQPLLRTTASKTIVLDLPLQPVPPRKRPSRPKRRRSGGRKPRISDSNCDVSEEVRREARSFLKHFNKIKRDCGAKMSNTELLGRKGMKKSPHGTFGDWLLSYPELLRARPPSATKRERTGEVQASNEEEENTGDRSNTLSTAEPRYPLTRTP